MVKLDIAPKNGRIGDPMVITAFENNIPVQSIEVSIGEGRDANGDTSYHIVVSRIGTPRPSSLQLVK